MNNEILDKYLNRIEEHLTTVLYNLNKLDLVQYYYDKEYAKEKILYFFEFDDNELFLNGYKIDILKLILSDYDNKNFSKKELYFYLDQNYSKTLRKTIKKVKSYFDFELKEKICDEFIKDKDKIKNEYNIIVGIDEAGNPIRKYVQYHANLMIENKDIPIKDIPHFIPPEDETEL